MSEDLTMPEPRNEGSVTDRLGLLTAKIYDNPEGKVTDWWPYLVDRPYNALVAGNLGIRHLLLRYSFILQSKKEISSHPDGMNATYSSNPDNVPFAGGWQWYQDKAMDTLLSKEERQLWRSKYTSFAPAVNTVLFYIQRDHNYRPDVWLYTPTIGGDISHTIPPHHRPSHPENPILQSALAKGYSAYMEAWDSILEPARRINGRVNIMFDGAGRTGNGTPSGHMIDVIRQAWPFHVGVESPPAVPGLEKFCAGMLWEVLRYKLEHCEISHLERWRPNGPMLVFCSDRLTKASGHRSANGILTQAGLDELKYRIQISIDNGCQPVFYLSEMARNHDITTRQKLIDWLYPGETE